VALSQNYWLSEVRGVLPLLAPDWWRTADGADWPAIP